MRQVLVDHARRKGAEKRAGDQQRITLTDALGQTVQLGSDAIDALALHNALHRLAQIRPRAAQVVELRYFGGLTLAQTSGTLGVTPKTVTRDWNTARLWLLDRMKSTWFYFSGWRAPRSLSRFESLEEALRSLEQRGLEIHRGPP